METISLRTNCHTKARDQNKNKVLCFWFSSFAFFSFCFPKAGILVGNYPINISLVLFLLCLVFSVKKLPAFFARQKACCLFTILILIIGIVNFSSFDLLLFFKAALLVLSPLAFVFLDLGFLSRKKCGKILMVSLLVTSLYSIIQFFFGITKVVIPGLTVAFGENIATKNIGFGRSSVSEALKMPSTYQNGNGIALLFLCGIPYILTNYKFLNKKWKVLGGVSLITSTFGFLLSGSRSAFWGLLLSAIFCGFLSLFRSRRKIRLSQNTFLILIISLFIVIFFFIFTFNDNRFIQQIFYRLFIQLFNDKTGSNRTVQVQELFSIFQESSLIYQIRFIFLGFPWNWEIQAEGIFLLFAVFGVVPTFLFFFLLFQSFYRIFARRNISFSIGFLAVIICFLVDSSYFYIPALMNSSLIFSLIVGKPKNEQVSR